MSSSISEKIRKLMALAEQKQHNAADANEAASAAAMAAELAMKYNIELDSIEKDHAAAPKQFKKGDYATSALPRDKQAHMLMANGVADLYGCKWLIRVAHNSNSVVFIGQPHNVELCNSWITYLWKAMMRCNVEYARTRTFASKKERYAADLAFRLQFASQVYTRLKEKLASMKTQGVADGGGTALMVVNWYEQEKQEVAEWMQTHLSPGKPTSTRTKKLDWRAAAAGYEAGKKVGLHDQIGTKNHAPGVAPPRARIA
jgi:hypothetical protein